MNAIDEIMLRLAKYPEVRYTKTGTSIEVHAACETGFPVGLHVDGERFVVSLAGWHERFQSQEEALDCFAFGLSTHCRLQVLYRGSTPTGCQMVVRWLESIQEDPTEVGGDWGTDWSELWMTKNS